MLRRTFGIALAAVAILLSNQLGFAFESRVQSAARVARGLDEPWPAGVPIRACAIRVEFVADDVTGTTGTGLMGSGFPDSLHIDPLPHDRAYFEDHLAFLRHYYETASKGSITFSALDVLPPADNAAYQLAFPMWHYNYNVSDELLNQRLVELFVQAAELADADVDFSNYDAILIFHAGVGKDFSFGYDFTPFDIPSAYIGFEDLQTYPGSIPAGVTRGLILPEGENQQEALELGVELSLNGIMVKLFGNWLGMPDLFNTQAGRSGIGRWGMMDQGSGNLGALVPALPDAWSRAYMGWEEVSSVVQSRLGDTLSIARFEVDGAPEIVKLPITPKEYYLIENRDADADSIGFVELRDRDGRIMQIDIYGNISIESEFRVPVSANDYDFGIPGSGLLIWHIDESVIEANLETNTVNANPSHRGVDLVEADAAQDIGEEYGFATAGSGAELGVAEDAWYFGNEAHRAANGGTLQVRFTDRTYPSARLYDGAYTNFELSGFSPVDSVMSFRYVSASIAPGFPVALPAPAEWGVADLDGDGFSELYLASAESFYRADSIDLTTIGILPPGVRPVELDAMSIDSDSLDELLLEGSRFGIVEQVGDVVSVRLSQPQSSTDVKVYPAQTNDGVPMLMTIDADDDGVPPDFVVASLYTLDFELVESIEVVRGSAVNSVPLNVESLPATTFIFLRDQEAVALQVGMSGFDELWRVQNGQIQPQGTVLAEPDRRYVYLHGYGYVEANTGAPLCLEPQCIAPGVDWDGDGIPDGGGLTGANTVPREDAPDIPADVEWVIDLDVDRQPDLFGYGALQDSVFTRVYAADHDGGTFASFPIAANVRDARLPFAWTPANTLFYLSEVFANGAYYYSVSRIPIQPGSGARFPYREDNAIINVGPLQPSVHSRSDWLYCWPNPTNSVSYIRLTLDYPAQARVKVFDLTGRQVAELSGASSVAGPFELEWNVSAVESGIYVGQVTAEGGGKTEQAQLKIAVVR